jgi:hypothetical protein
LSTVAPPRLFELPLTTERKSSTSDRGTPARSPNSDGGRLTLEQRLECVWEGLSAAGVAPCPLCGGRMLREFDAARCTGCGSTLT